MHAKYNWKGPRSFRRTLPKSIAMSLPYYSSRSRRRMLAAEREGNEVEMGLYDGEVKEGSTTSVNKLEQGKSKSTHSLSSVDSTYLENLKNIVTIIAIGQFMSVVFTGVCIFTQEIATRGVDFPVFQNFPPAD